MVLTIKKRKEKGYERKKVNDWGNLYFEGVYCAICTICYYQHGVNCNDSKDAWISLAGSGVV